MQPNDSGDGSGLGPTGEEPLITPPPIEGEVSQTAEELNAKIEAELGLPHTEVKASEETTDESTDIPDNAGSQPENAEASEEASDEDVSEHREPSNQAPVISDEDLFIEVEDANGEKYKITKIEDLPEDFEAKNNRQGYEILHQLGKLEAKIDARDTALAEQARQEAETAAQTEQFDAWDREIESLGKEKRIDTSDQERINKVFEHISSVNEARVKANNPNLITSFEDGLDKYEKIEAKQQQDDKLKQDNDRAKLKSSLIGGGSSPTGGGAARPYVSGSARSMDDLII